MPLLYGLIPEITLTRDGLQAGAAQCAFVDEFISLVPHPADGFVQTVPFPSTAGTFFAVVDPIGTVPVFIAVTSAFDGPAKRRIALVAGVILYSYLAFYLRYERRIGRN